MSSFKRLMSRKRMKIETIDVEPTIENTRKLLKNDPGGFCHSPRHSRGLSSELHTIALTKHPIRNYRL